jgi:glycosyltransferase involved in cell wall biosynthesis
MKNITLAIPFYNTSKYFLDAVKYALDNDFVREIVVNDDCSTEEEYEKLKGIIEELDNTKIKLFRNDENLGGFRNKYVTVKNSTSDWIYLLDSDNHLTENTLDVIESIENPEKNICYCPEKLLLHNAEDGYTNEADYKFKYDLIESEEAKDGIIKRTKWFDWFLNTGNYVFNRETYLNFIEKPFEEKDTQLLHADVIALSYFWLKCGGSFKVVPNFNYHHRLRSDSYWNACGNYSSASVDYYKEMILNL